LIVDDHPTFLSGLRALLETLPDTEICDEATSGAEAVIKARDSQPDVVLMDIEMAGMDGIEATRRIVSRCPDIAVLMLTMFEDSPTILAALRAGASGYFVKGSSRDDIAHAVVAVSHGHMILGASIATAASEHLTKPRAQTIPFAELTTRERDVLELVAQGRSNVEIARHLGLSTKTVRNYLSRTFAKLRVSHRTEAAVLARQHGLGV